MLGSKQWAYISGATSTFQLHVVPLGGIYPSICLLSGCAAAGSVRYVRELMRYPWFWFTCILFVLQALSLLWSPSHRIGARTLIYQIPFITLSLAMVHVARHNPIAAERIIKVTVAGTVIQALAVILFRILPQYKHAYLNSVFADLFESANRLAVFGGEDQSNVVDPSKSAGFTTYPNPASAWLGLAGMSAWYLSRLYKSRFLTYVAVLDCVAVFFTGSKAGILAACAVITLMTALDIALQVARTRKLEIHHAIIACFGVAAIGVATPFFVEGAAKFLGDSSFTLSSRQELWAFAKDEFRVHPIEGLGFGGWERKVPIQGRVTQMPPHNAFIILWSQSGILAVLIGAGFASTFLWWAFDRIRSGVYSERMVAKGLFAGYLWLFIQAQGENFGLFGEDHMKPILALMAGLLAGLRYQALNDPEQPRNDEVIAPKIALG